MDVLVTSKNKEEPNKNEGASVATTLNIDFSNTKGQLTPQSGVGSGRNLKNEEDPIKIEGATVAKTLNINFSNTQGQLTPQSRVGSG